ncbi:CxxxxCH/CxxCH domain c-type cytochrome [Anaeromyxobacter paludicola]|uniref:Uncharacterized protein n=1 Tax=Anaeromyxobacter paludicola TaxID=2918171 RepID=A0ABM7XFB8_9BACT|nr:CxxxxCH/CxxCH domain-containing protein [Anaeromyxobacter paludicola]BDG10587.1 hypothetical protein AMPC_37000 [Anaeromyxobacter paludicola]
MGRPLRAVLVLAAGLVGAGCGSSRETVVANDQTTCTTCHGMPPATGAHLAHVDPLGSGSPSGAVLQKPLDCDSCHFKPHAVNDPGHIVQANGQAVPKPAQVRFDLGPFGAKQPAAVFDPATRTCSNVYCHGGTGVSAGGILTAPRWEDPPSSAACGTCHGIPPTDHDPRIAQTACANCHAPSITPFGALDPATHLDGQVTLGTGVTGIHAAHVSSPISQGLACTECHVSPPSNVSIDFTGKLAATTGLTPAYDPNTGKCSSTYCHGNGTTTPSASPRTGLASTGGTTKTPVWVADGSSAQCNTCHGYPPTNHDPSQTSCGDCHTRTGGTNKVIKDKSAHVNGILDF